MWNRFEYSECPPETTAIGDPQMNRDRRNSLGSLLVLSLLALFTADSASAGVSLSCNTSCTMGMCSVTASCKAGAPNTCFFVGESIVTGMSVSIILGAADGMANVSAMGVSPSASIRFSNYCGATTMCTMGLYSTITDVCFVNDADGLPVELMDFEVNPK